VLARLAVLRDAGLEAADGNGGRLLATPEDKVASREERLQQR